jgi:hypothetical protein
MKQALTVFSERKHVRCDSFSLLSAPMRSVTNTMLHLMTRSTSAPPLPLSLSLARSLAFSLSRSLSRSRSRSLARSLALDRSLARFRGAFVGDAPRASRSSSLQAALSSIVSHVGAQHAKMHLALVLASFFALLFFSAALFHFSFSPHPSGCLLADVNSCACDQGVMHRRWSCVFWAETRIPCHQLHSSVRITSVEITAGSVINSLQILFHHKSRTCIAANCPKSNRARHITKKKNIAWRASPYLLQCLSLSCRFFFITIFFYAINQRSLTPQKVLNTLFIFPATREPCEVEPRSLTRLNLRATNARLRGEDKREGKLQKRAPQRRLQAKTSRGDCKRLA